MNNRINIIVAADLGNAIGYKNELLYNIKDDMKHFKELTTGGVVIMGKNTYESLPNGALPNRENVIITSNSEYEAPYCLLYDSLTKAIDDYRKSDKEVFIIGGGSIYKQTMNLMEEGDRIFMTRIGTTTNKADVWFPSINNLYYKPDYGDWKKDDKTGLKYQFITYVKERYVPTHKIFLSLPFTGVEKTIKQRLESAKDFVINTLAKKTGCQYEFVTQSSINQIIETGDSFCGDDYASEMIEDIKRISECNAILMCSGWNSSKGCNFEHEAAKLFNKRIYYQF